MSKQGIHRPHGLGDLTPEEWERLQEGLDRFEDAWKGGKSVDLAAFLPPSDDRLRGVALYELVKTELEIRWRGGQTISVDHYLMRYPELRQSPTLLPQLIYEEYRVRQLYGDQPPVAAYEQRFPEQFESFRRLIREQPVPASTPAATAVKPPLTAATPSRPIALDTAGQPAPTRANAPVIAPLGSMTPLGQTSGAMLSAGGGGYELVKRIGSGTFGEVWLAKAPGGVEVAIKMIIRPLDQAEAQREMESLELIKRLRHSFLLQTQAFWSLEDRLIIVMELADGNLRDRLKECRKAGMPGIPLHELATYFRESAEGLDFLHSRHVHHRDVKPDNILILQGHAKVADFGLARMLEGRQLITATGAGTPSYMAPEVWQGRISRHSDQYSLALSYAELRLNRRVFQSHVLVVLMKDHLESMPDLSPLADAEQEVLLRALAKDPEKRHENCQAFLAALEMALATELGRASISMRSPDTIKTSHSTKGPMALTSPMVPATTPDPGSLQTRGSGTHPVALPEVGKKQLSRRLWLAAAVASLPVVGWGAWKLFRDEEEPVVPGPGGNNVFLPKGFTRAPEATVEEVGGKKLYSGIVYEVDRDMQVPFLLVRRKVDSDPPTFYIMRDKVWIGLFQKFASTAKDALSAWLQRDAELEKADKRLPARWVTAEEAYQFARWLGGGNLPTTSQWDKAAGLYSHDQQGRRGPFKDSGSLRLGSDIAVGLEEPLPVGSAASDESWCGCRDMSGNGREWTRDVASSLDHPYRTLPLPSRPLEGARVLVMLRGKNFLDPEPVYFDKYPSNDAEHYDLARSRDISFRVVIEL